jgi:hypothetical protein
MGCKEGAEMKDSELFEKCADDVSRENGWIQGRLGEPYEPDAPVCMAGAVARYVSVEDQTINAHACRLRALERDIGCEIGGIALWNDKLGRTAGEVADQFRTTAKRLREEGL